MPRPTFLLLGAAKAGTTAVHAWLDAHPDVCMARPKEPHTFDLHADVDADVQYAVSFAHHDGEAALGEATPSYLTLPFVPARVHRSLPDVRLAAVLRHPVDRAYSSWWMLRSRGFERASFDDAVAACLREDDQESDEDAQARWRRFMDQLAARRVTRDRPYLRGSRYVDGLRRYEALYGPGAVHVTLFDDLVARPGHALGAMCAAIGVAPPPSEAPLPPHNTAIGTHTQRLLRVGGWPGLRAVRQRLPKRWRAGLRRAAHRAGARPAMRASTRATLLEHFAPLTDQLEDHLDLDLSAWRI